jgi:hypothetical protein
VTEAEFLAAIKEATVRYDISCDDCGRDCIGYCAPGMKNLQCPHCKGFNTICVAIGAGFQSTEH